MAGRRRVRVLAAVLLFVVVAIVYTRKAQVETYRDYVAGKVAGGGAVLRGKPEERKPEERKPEERKPEEQKPAALPTSEPAPLPTTTSTRSTRWMDDAPSSTSLEVASTSTADETRADFPELTWKPSRAAAPTTSAVSTATLVYAHPAITEDDELVYEVGEGRVDNEDPLVSATSTIHWTKHPEHFPIATTIALPTGSSKPFSRIQYAGANAGQADTERLAVIKEAAEHAWNGYADAAFGMDEIKPISGGYNNPFNGWGATLVDSLDTLWIMGMTDAFEAALEHVQMIDFTTSVRSDIPLFETTIRYLGGLIAAYDISGQQPKYRILLDKAVELAEVLYSAFDTPNRMPVTFYRWKPAFASQPHRAGNRVVMAEIGSLSLEFTRLAQVTGEPKYYDAIARVTDAFQEWQNSTRIPGMWPTQLDASGCEKPAQMGSGRTSSSINGAQQPVPGGTGQMMHASEPVKQGAGSAGSTANVVHKAGKAVVDVEEQLAAQAKLDAQAAARQPGMGKIIGHGNPIKEGSLDGKSRGELAADFGAIKEKRQLDGWQANPATSRPRNGTAKTDLRSTPAEGSSIEAMTGQGICIPQGLASTSKYSSESFTLGGQSDSTYEYLPKQYMLLGGLTDQYMDMYVASADAAINNLLFRPMTVDERDLLISGNMKVSINSTDGSLIKRFSAEGEHLTCFAGGMFAMGGKLFDRPGDIEIGRKLTEGCVWAYNSTTTGIMPETFTAVECEQWDRCEWNQTEYWHLLDPYAATRTKNAKALASTADETSYMATATAAAAAMEELRTAEAGRWDDLSSVATATATEAAKDQLKAAEPDRWDDAASTATASAAARPAKTSSSDTDTRIGKRQLEKLRDADVSVRPRPAATPSARARPGPIEYDLDVQFQPAPAAAAAAARPIYTPKAPLSHDDFVKKKIEDERLPPGFLKLNDKRYILRPEAIESVFYMYRITGEQYWRDMGWKMFTAIDEHTRAQYGNSAIDDVTKMAPELKDTMESFWLAETLKYFYLLFDDPDRLSLDDWVLNTEAHFFKRPKYEFAE